MSSTDAHRLQSRFPLRLTTVRVTALCFVMAVCAWGGYFYGNSFYMAALVATHGWSVGAVSTAISIGFFTCIPASIAVGWMLDLHGRSWGALAVVTYGAVALGGGIAALGQVESLWQLHAVYALMGSAYPALAAPAISAVLAQRGAGGYGLRLSIALTGASVGGVVTAPALVWATARFGLEAALVAVAGLIVLLLIPFAAWCLRPIGARASTSTGAPAGPAARAVLGEAVFWRIAAASLLSLAAQVGFLAHQLSILGERLAPGSAALVVSLTATASVVGRFAVGALSARVPLRHLASATYMTMAIGISIVALGSTPAALLAGCVVTGLFVGAVVLLPPLLCRAAFDTAIYGRAYGFVAVGVYAGGGLGPVLAGLVRDATGESRVALLGLAGLSVAAAAIVSTVRSRPSGNVR